jgi:hypothetical protein
MPAVLLWLARSLTLLDFFAQFGQSCPSSHQNCKS